MTKGELIEQVVTSRAGMDLTPQAAGVLLDHIFGIVSNAITKDGAFSYPGLGTVTMAAATETGGTHRTPRPGPRVIKSSPVTGSVSRSAAKHAVKDLMAQR